MKPRDSFGVVVRVFGLLSFLIGLFWVCLKSLFLLEATYSSGSADDSFMLMRFYYGRGHPVFGFFYAAIFLLVGYLLMRGANCIVKWLYPDGES